MWIVRLLIGLRMVLLLMGIAGGMAANENSDRGRNASSSENNYFFLKYGKISQRYSFWPNNE